jgi:hypothetical protein
VVVAKAQLTGDKPTVDCMTFRKTSSFEAVESYDPGSAASIHVTGEGQERRRTVGTMSLTSRAHPASTTNAGLRGPLNWILDGRLREVVQFVCSRTA